MKKQLTLHFKVLFRLKYKRWIGIASIAAVLLSAEGCRIFNPSIMLRTPRDYPYAQGVDTIAQNYVLQPGDLITFQLFSNEGFRIIVIATIDERGGNLQMFNQQNLFQYLIEPDSNVNLPIVGRVNIAGMNLKDAELYLEDKYANYYNEPFVRLRVVNRRVVVFPGGGGRAQVINITNESTSLIEALAMAGGLDDGARAHRVKVIRPPYSDPQVFDINLSTLEGFKEAKVYYVRANDIIYVQPSYFAGKQIISTTTQVLGLISSIVLTLVLVQNYATPN
ncbi:MAG: polysaccharide biosynthesis/export family protein [Salibacteraceae bacterium]